MAFVRSRSDIPENVRDRIVELPLDEPELSPRELAVRFTDTQGYFVSEALVYRVLKTHDLIASPAFVVVKPRQRHAGRRLRRARISHH